MILTIPTSEQIKKAQDKAAQLGRLNNSIMEGGGNVYGFLGEELILDYLGGQICNTFDYDLIIDEVKIDVKTKCCTSEPKPNYFCSVAAFNIRQRCDYYYFVRILKDFGKAWILGYCGKEEFYETAKFYKKGQPDPDSKFGWTFRADCYNLEISKLKT